MIFKRFLVQLKNVFVLLFSCCIGYSFKFILKVGVEESIVNAPLVSLRGKNTNNAKVRLDLNN
jgi:hypothetical protein